MNCQRDERTKGTTKMSFMVSLHLIIRFTCQLKVS